MNIHKNARTTPQSRALLVHRVRHEHWPVSAVALALGVSERTVYKCLARYHVEGAAGLHDRRRAWTSVDGRSYQAMHGSNSKPEAHGSSGSADRS